MASEKLNTPNNVEPFGDPNGKSLNTSAQGEEKSIYVYSGGECIRNFIGTFKQVSQNHFQICEGGELFEIYNATVIVSKKDRINNRLWK